MNRDRRVDLAHIEESRLDPALHLPEIQGLEVGLVDESGWSASPPERFGCIVAGLPVGAAFGTTKVRGCLERCYYTAPNLKQQGEFV